MNRCRSCKQTVFWIVTPNGKKTPVDPTPIAHGMGWKQTPDLFGEASWTLAEGTPEAPVYPSHFFSCPDAEAWRKR